MSTIRTTFTRTHTPTAHCPFVDSRNWYWRQSEPFHYISWVSSITILSIQISGFFWSTSKLKLSELLLLRVCACVCECIHTNRTDYSKQTAVMLHSTDRQAHVTWQRRQRRRCIQYCSDNISHTNSDEQTQQIGWFAASATSSVQFSITRDVNHIGRTEFCLQMFLSNLNDRVWFP